jgi:hypothetical protein
MGRVFALILFAITATTAARATLAVVVPSADGLVVAADSRESILETECDGNFKIIEPRRPDRTVVIVTGDAIFVSPPPWGTGTPANQRRPQDACAYIQSAPRLLDIAAVVTRYLEKNKTPVENLSLDALAYPCVAALRRFQESHADALQTLIGRDVFSVLVAHYDPKSRASILLNFIVHIDAATREIRSGRAVRTVIRPRNRRGVWAFGETDYLNQNVYRGFGREFLTASTQSLILDDMPVIDTPLDQSVAAAVNVIRAAARTTETVPAPSGIGGSISVVLLGYRRRPQPISPAEWRDASQPSESRAH